MKLFFYYKFRFYTSKLNEICLHCHRLYFSSIIMSFGQGESPILRLATYFESCVQIWSSAFMVCTCSNPMQSSVVNCDSNSVTKLRFWHVSPHIWHKVHFCTKIKCQIIFWFEILHKDKVDMLQLQGATVISGTQRFSIFWKNHC